MAFNKKEIKVPIYTGTLFIVDSDSRKKIKKVIKNFDDKQIYAHSLLFDNKGMTGYGIVLNFNYKKAKITHGVIAHEAYHITSYIAEEHGLEWNVDNDEPLAYLINWVVDQVYLFVKEYGLKVELEKH